jgi:hypothetical protein
MDLSFKNKLNAKESDLKKMIPEKHAYFCKFSIT